MNNFISYALWMLAFLQLSCNSNKKSEAIKSTGTINDTPGIEVIRFPENGEDTLKLSQIADTVIYIPLETNSKSLISKRITGIWMNDSIILINNRINLLMFSREGKYIRQIGKKGKGPGEYQLINNFEVNRDTIYFNSTDRKSLSKYTMDGTFCGEVQVTKQPTVFTFTNSGKFVWYNRNTGKIYMFHDNFRPADTLVVEHGVTIGRYRYINSDDITTYFHKSTSGLYFTNYMNDTVWDISNGQKRPAYILDMKDKLLPYDKQIEFSGGDFKRRHKEIEPFLRVHLVHFPSWMFIFEKNYEDEHTAFYIQNKLTSESQKYNTSYIYDDIVSHQKLSSFIFPNSPEFLFAKIPAYELKENLDKNTDHLKEKASPQWLDQMKDVGGNDNFILVLIKVKQELQ